MSFIHILHAFLLSKQQLVLNGNNNQVSTTLARFQPNYQLYKNNHFSLKSELTGFLCEVLL